MAGDTIRPASALVGRAAELARIGALLDDARAGNGGGLVLVGPPGQGKTALLEEVARTAESWRVVRLRGQQAESDLPWGGLTQLEHVVRPMAEHVRNSDALEAAFGVGPARAPVSRLAVLMAVLDAFAALAEPPAPPVLVLVDDLHWLDDESARTVSFLMQRLDGLRVAMVCARRDVTPASATELALPPLDVSASELLLAEEELSSTVRAALVRALDGNPLALRETVRSLTDAQRTGAAPLPDPLPVGAELEATYGARLDGLSAATREALLLIAASRDVEARALSLPPEVLEPAEAAGLVDLGPGGATFRHPLVQSAVYWAADPTERRAVHRRLAAVSRDPFATAWHRAAAAVGPDAEVAVALVDAARSAVARGAFRTGASALQRAAELEPDVRRAGEHLVEAATAALDAGDVGGARLLVDAVPADTGGVGRLRVRLAALQGAGAEAAARLSELAEELAPVDVEAACQALLEGAVRCLPAGLALEAQPLLERAAELHPQSEPLATLLDVARGVFLCLSGPRDEGLALVARYESLLDQPDPPLVALASLVAPLLAFLGQPEAVGVIDGFFARVGERPEAAMALPVLHYARGITFVDLSSGIAAAANAVALADALDAPALAEGPLQLLVITLGMAGDPALEASAERLLAGATFGSMPDASARSARSVLAILERRYQDAVADLLPLWEWEAGEFKTARIWYMDLAEAAVLAGQVDLGRQALQRLRDLIALVGVGTSPFLDGSAARVEGLLATPEECSALFEHSVEQILRAGRPWGAARTALVWGERLRRERRRADARAPLAQARDLFDSIGAARWAVRAEQELAASGGAVAVDTAQRGSRLLTPKQLEVARWAVAGLTYREIAERLFVSPRTVEAHLSTIYRRLGVRNRAELAARATTDPSLVEP